MKMEKQGIEERLNIDLEWEDKHVFPPVINPHTGPPVEWG